MKELIAIENESDYEFYYRGHTNENYRLIPSIYRNEGWITNENRMFRELVIKCPEDFKNLETTFQMLVKMQHYKLPTRLLDLTGNPLIALYYACQQSQDQKKTNGEIIIFKIPKEEIKYYDSDTVSVISNISKQPNTFSLGEKVKNLDPKEFSNSNALKLLLHDVRQEKSGFEPKIERKDLESVICVKPMQDNPRIVRQDGAFFLFGVDQDKKKPAKIPAKYSSNSIQKRLIINTNHKQKILDQLKALGINDSKVYPELDSVAVFVKQTFKQ
ncbi:MAG: FRG domain-containing protein [Candidatus Paceibacterota bacterium]